MNLKLKSPFSVQANELLQSSRRKPSRAEKERTLRESLKLYKEISQHTDLPQICLQYRQGRAWPSGGDLPLVQTR